MRSLALLPLAVGLGFALPQDGCSTVTTEVIQPTSTQSLLSTAVVTVHATTPDDLGTFTLRKTVSSTKTLQTLTGTTATCGETGVVTVPFATETIYGGPPGYIRAHGLNRRDGCTVTVTTTTTFGAAYTWVPANKTRTYTEYTAFTQTTVTETFSDGTAYAIATALTTVPTTCGSVTVTPSSLTTTVTRDPRCSPGAMASAYDSFGIEYLEDTPYSGATWETETVDASACCQLCATSWECAASAWDIRTGACKLEFPVDLNTADLNCGAGMIGVYDAGPVYPMRPGTGWYIATLCGTASYAGAPPDDGT